MKRKCLICNSEFDAKPADVRRGWGKYCNKSCAATANNRKTGNYQRYLTRVARKADNLDESSEFTNAHQFSNEDYFDSKESSH